MKYLVNGLNIGGYYVYNVYVYLDVDGQFTQTVAAKRNDIFRRELPLAIQAIRYGDSRLFHSYPALNNSSDNSSLPIHIPSLKQGRKLGYFCKPILMNN